MEGPRRVALIGKTRGGKTTFAAANARGNVYAIDSDQGFVRMRDLVSGNIHEPSTVRGRIDPLFIHTECEEAIYGNKKIGTIVVDTVTRIYGIHARKASMLGRMSTQQRVAQGGSKNKASDMVDKSNAIAVLSNLASYGTDIYYLWHERDTVDMTTFEGVTKDTISDSERENLMTAIDIVLRFSSQKVNGDTVYTVYVDPETRDYGLKRANKGFSITDKPGNLWRGMMDRLERLIYTSFDGADSAVAWAAERLNHDDPGEIRAVYDDVKERVQPRTSSQMWVAWIEAVDDLVAKRQDKPQEKPVAVSAPAQKKEEPEEQPQEEPAEETVKAVETQVVAQPVTVAAPAPANGTALLEYGNGDPVADADAADFQKFVQRFNRAPDEAKQLHKAVEINTGKGEW